MKQELVFYRPFNGIFGKVGRYASEDVVLSLVTSKCLPVLLYATEVCLLLSRDLSLNSFALTGVLKKFFCSRSNDVINERRAVFGILPIKQQMQIRKVRFLQNVIDSYNTVCSLFATSELLCLCNAYSANERNIIETIIQCGMA